MGFVIREARPEEYAAIGELTVTAYEGTGEIVEDYAHELRDVANRAREVPVLAALDDPTGRLLGTATYVPGPGPYHEGEFGDIASMRMLAVAGRAGPGDRPRARGGLHRAGEDSGSTGHRALHPALHGGRASPLRVARVPARSGARLGVRAG